MPLVRPRLVAPPDPDLRAFAVGAGLGVLKPTAATTGCLPGITRTTVSGSVTLSTPGQTYRDKNVTGRVTVTAANVSIKNVRANDFNLDSAGVSNCLLEDSEVVPNAQLLTNGGAIVGHDFTCRRVMVRDHIDGFVIRNPSATPPYDTNIVIEHSWVNKLAYWTDDQVGTVHSSDTWSHNDGIQHMGGWGTQVYGSVIDASFRHQYAHWNTVGASETEPYTSVALNSMPDGGPWHLLPDRGTGTAATGRYNSDSASPVKAISLTGFLIGNNVIGGFTHTSRELIVDGNWFYGGDFGFNGGGFNRGTETNQLLTLTNNRFSRDQGNQGAGGDDTFTVAGFGSGWSSFITRSNNTYEDNGNPVTYRIP